MPSDPPNVGTQIHGLTQLECAAAGCALVLSDVEAFPEVFGTAAHILPVIGKYRPELERRITAEDYAAIVVELMRDQEKWKHASTQARALAEQHTWSRVVDNWEAMLGVRECAKT
jgi:glycosyltransferase involved in cell wall biosynthesis